MFVERLPLPQRQVLLLRYMLDLPHEATAKALGLSPENVRILHHRALRFLEERLTAIGRAPGEVPRNRSRGTLKQAPVLRTRRFALL
jgi:DNA-directed RNA polymerase specialized sigma24 family protein